MSKDDRNKVSQDKERHIEDKQHHEQQRRPGQDRSGERINQNDKKDKYRDDNKR
jgi:hypothetical protein